MAPCRYYLFTYPEVMVADPEMIKQITIKYFDKFTDRQVGKGFGGTEIQGKIYNGLLLLRGQKWKESRHVVTPAFTTSKMKLVSVRVWLGVYMCACLHACVYMCKMHNHSRATTDVSLSPWKMEPLMRKSTLKLVEKLKEVADTDQSVNALE